MIDEPKLELDLDALARVARAASKGPWRAVSDHPVFAIAAGEYRVVQTPNQNNYRSYTASQRWLGIESASNAEYIATAGPDVLLALIARVLAAEQADDEGAERDLDYVAGEWEIRAKELKDRAEKAERERDGLQAVIERNAAADGRAMDEVERLQARLDEAEKLLRALDDAEQGGIADYVLANYRQVRREARAYFSHQSKENSNVLDEQVRDG